MKNLILLFTFTGFLFSATQDTKDALEMVKTQDVSNIFTCNTFKYAGDDGFQSIDRMPALGFLGSSYHRIRIHFLSVVKNADDPLEYFVHGKSKYKGNVCDFQGTLRLTAAEETKELEFPDQRVGWMKGTYTFYEDQKQSGTGTFSGNFTSYWWMNPDGQLEYNGLLAGMDDGFSNNEFEGVWTSHRSGKSSTCNWGDYRIPGSDPLDQGAGEFVPAEQYLDNGWRSYLKMVMGGSEAEWKKAVAEEKATWWKNE